MATALKAGATHVALLRGVNLAGNKKVAMADLKKLIGSLGLDDQQTLLQSGNVVFRCKGRTCDRIERQIETALRNTLGLQSHAFVRSVDEWRALIAANPFPREAAADPSRFLVMCLRESPSAAAVAALQSSIVGKEKVRARGRHAYFIYPDGVGQSKLTHYMIEKQLGIGTARNWNTVRKIDALLGTERPERHGVTGPPRGR